MNKQILKDLSSDPEKIMRATAIETLLASIPGEDNGREGLRETPWRVAKMLDEMCWGYKADPRQTLQDAMFTEDTKSLVVVKDIPFASLCEHHMMPFFGTISIAYIPQDGKVVGISKLARVAEVFSKRLQVQERLGKNILDTIKDVMNPYGCAVHIKAEHTCMTARGIQKPGTKTITSHLDGVFLLDEKARAELMINLQ